MKIISATLVVLLLGVISTTSGQSANVVAPRPPSLSSGVARTACVPEAADLGAVCGYVRVPFDRMHPNQGTIRIYFELYRHSEPGPAESAILVNFGGPGVATSGLRGLAFDFFGRNLGVHDLLLIDDRGRGLSGALGVTNCLEVQQGTAPWNQALADCATQLGNAASRYGTGDVAQDTEAVRAALGYEKVDYFGWSYGGTDVSAYATRFGNHLRSIILDSPSGAPNLEPFVFEQTRTQAYPRIIRLECSRSPTCSSDHRDPVADLDELILAVRLRPVIGNGYDAYGNLTHVRVDEETLLSVVIAHLTGNFTGTGEILAAAESLRRGDSKPLLRLAAEASPAPFPPSGDWGDPTTFQSIGAQYATSCVDHHQVWNWSATIPEREQQYSDAVADLPADYFAPFSKAAATAQSFSWFGSDCLFWQKPTPSSPVAPPPATYPFVPALVFSGDLDPTVPLEETHLVAALFPNSTFLPVAEIGHGSLLHSQCARDLASEFIETLQIVDPRCAHAPEIVWPAVGRFPLLAKDARPARVDPGGTNEIGIPERQVVTVAVAAATDALQRSQMGDGIGVGLRTGTFRTNSDSVWQVTLKDCAFTTDVVVNGSLTLGPDQSLVADLAVTGPGTAGGIIHVVGHWEAPGPVGNFQITGKLGGKRVAVLVPEA